MSRIQSRLLAYWHGASADQRAAGLAWYAEARATCRDLARRNGTTVRAAAGVVAALSPRLHWTPNVRAAEVVLAGGVPSGVFRASLRKAQAIARGASPLKVLGGAKVRAFYRAILGDTSAAVVDVWVLRASGWAKSLTPRAYALISRALTAAAASVGVAVAHMQAVVWVAIRGRA